MANANLIATKGIEIAFVQNDITYWAVNGQLMFQGKPLKNIRAVASLYPEHVQMVVTKDSGIKKFTDLKGKRVGVGAPGSGVEGDVQALFKALPDLSTATSKRRTILTSQRQLDVLRMTRLTLDLL